MICLSVFDHFAGLTLKRLSVSIVLLSLLLSHECSIESKGPYIYDAHTEGTRGVLEIRHLFAGSTVFKQ